MPASTPLILLIHFNLDAVRKDFCNAGTAKERRTASIAIITSNSTRVKIDFDLTRDFAQKYVTTIPIIFFMVLKSQTQLFHPEGARRLIGELILVTEATELIESATRPTLVPDNGLTRDLHEEAPSILRKLRF